MLRDLNLDALNSATKYPSIPTYHRLAGGVLTEDPVSFTGDVILTEKIDGTNARIIVLPTGEYVIGSREELLYARGDVIGNPALGIVAELRGVADHLDRPPAGVRVLYLEVYGGKTTAAARQYTGHRAVGHRLLDVADIPAEVLGWNRPRIAAWRDGGGQEYLTEDALLKFAAAEGIAAVPRLAALDAADLPATLTGMHDLITGLLPKTRAPLDAGAGGRPEGIVLRTPDRSVIAKARTADYTRAFCRAARKLGQGLPEPDTPNEGGNR